MNTFPSKVDKYNILYLNNPDKVYYNELDSVIISNLEQENMIVRKVELDDINFQMEANQIKVFIKNEEVNVDGFLGYGYMSQTHFESYLLIIDTFEAMNVVCLHNSKAERILINKYLQGLSFARAGIPIPKTFQGYSIPSFKHIMKRNFEEKYVIVKKLDDYGGDGVKRCETSDLAVNAAAKLLWKGENCLFQEYVPDSIGKSIRVLCIGGEAVAIAEYIDKTGNFLSNNSYGDYFCLKSLMDSPERARYFKLGERAVKSIGNLTIAGVDILESQELGSVVLEVNGFPDIFDISKSTNLSIFSLFAKSFYHKIKFNKSN
jgi:glutathione synthase/RimK-type ligase-like ATP-grasp enzyme